MQHNNMTCYFIRNKCGYHSMSCAGGLCTHCPYISAATVQDLCWDSKQQSGRARVKLEEERCEILMVSLCVHRKPIHYSSHLEGRIAALSCRVLPTHVFALSGLLETLCSSADIWLCSGFGHSHAPLSISDLFFHFEKESTVTRVVKMDAVCECGSVFGPTKSGVDFWIPDLREHKQH